MTNSNISTEVEASPNISLADFDVTNLVGVFDVLVQMDLALNGYPSTNNPDTGAED